MTKQRASFTGENENIELTMAALLGLQGPLIWFHIDVRATINTNLKIPEELRPNQDFNQISVFIYTQKKIHLILKRKRKRSVFKKPWNRKNKHIETVLSGKLKKAQFWGSSKFSIQMSDTKIF